MARRCIFCGSESGVFKTREHVLPESLGGDDWAILPEGRLCDSCQNRFGSQIEQQATGDYPFSFLRTLIGIPTKKKKPPWFNSWEGVIRASLTPGSFEYYPNSIFNQATSRGDKSQIRIIAHPNKPEMVCRFLIKMGIEVVGWENYDYVFSSKFDAARRFALKGEKSQKWWYLQRENMDEVSYYIINGIQPQEWDSKVKLEVIKLDGEQEVFHLALLYLDMITPLTSLVTPQIDGLEEPDYRLFWV